MRAKQLQQALSGVIGLVIVLGIVIAANAVVGAVRLRKDLTEEQLYTLSEGTHRILGGLERTVTLKYYFSESNPHVPIPLKQFAQRVEDWLYEYELHSQGHVVLETYDPRPDSDEQQWAQRYGVTGQQLGMMAAQPDFYMGLVAVSGSQEAPLPLLAPNMDPRLEYLVTRMISEVTRRRKSRVGVLSSLPVMGAGGAPTLPPQAQPQPWLLISELEKQYEVVALESQPTAIDEELDAVIVIHPKQVPDRTLFALDQYLLGGGRFLLFTDPMCLAEQEVAPRGRNPFGNASNLNRLTQAWGLRTSADIVADPQLASRVTLQQGGSVEVLPTWLSLRNDQLNPDEVATADLELLMFPFAGSVQGEPKEGLALTPLAETTERAGFVSSFEALGQGSAAMNNARAFGTKPLAVRVEGTFQTAFENGPPADEANPKGAADAAANEAWLRESQEKSAAIFVADVDFLYDRVMVRTMNFFGQAFSTPINDNLNFLLNLVEQLAGNEALIGLRSRGSFDRPFHRVLELERQARERWQEEERKLTARLQETQQRLQALQQAKEEDQKYILSPEQQREIEAFQEQQFETQQQLREVRKNLRKEIERLGLQIKVTNMAAMPLLVALFGILHAWRRRRKALRASN